MRPTAHPSDETLLRFAAGTLPLGVRVVVAAHLSSCPCCRELVRAFEAVGGVLMDVSPSDSGPLALAPDALDAVLMRLDREDGAPAALARRRVPLAPPGLPEGFVLPAALSGCALGPLRPIAPGVRLGRVTVPGDPEADVILLRMGAGRRIPEHAHGGNELTQVLCGSYHDHLGHYGPGDLVEADGTLEHAPIVDADGECICLVAMEGRLRFRGVLGLVMRPFF